MIDYTALLTGFCLGLFIIGTCGLLNILIRFLVRLFLGSERS